MNEYEFVKQKNALLDSTEFLYIETKLNYNEVASNLKQCVYEPTFVNYLLKIDSNIKIMEGNIESVLNKKNDEYLLETISNRAKSLDDSVSKLRRAFLEMRCEIQKGKSFNSSRSCAPFIFFFFIILILFSAILQFMLSE